MTVIGFDGVDDEGCGAATSFSAASVVPGIAGTWLIIGFARFAWSSGAGFVTVTIDGYQVGRFYMDSTYDEFAATWSHVVTGVTGSSTVVFDYTLSGTLVAAPVAGTGSPTVDPRLEGFLICPA